MSKIISVGLADIPFKVSQSTVRDYAYRFFSRERDDVGRMIGVFDNAMIETRHFAIPEKWFEKRQPNFKERNKVYMEAALSLSKEAAQNCLETTASDTSQFDHIMFISSTGVAAPTIDALLINELKLEPHTKRTPIWGLGCVGGAAGISRALEYTRAYPRSAALVIALEICCLAFQKDDFSKSNLVAFALFSDGAAATLVAGRDHELSALSKLNLIDSLTTTYYDSLDVMGWEVVKTGFRAIFSKNIPSLVRNEVKPNIEELADRNNLSISDIKHFIVHPGGAKVIKGYEESLGLTNDEFRYSKRVLREHGNMSSPTVMYVLKEFMDEGDYDTGEYGIISALGPGFSSEIVLFQIGE